MIFKDISNNRLLFKVDNARGGAAAVSLKNDTDYKNIVVADEKQSEFIKQSVVKVDGKALGVSTALVDALSGYSPQPFSGKTMVPDNFSERIAELFAMNEETDGVYGPGKPEGNEAGENEELDNNNEIIVVDTSSPSNVRSTQNSATRLALILLPVAASMNNQAMLLSDQLDALTESIGIVLSSNADIAEMHTEKIIKDWKDRQKKIDDAHRRTGILGFCMVVVDAFVAVKHIGAALKDVAAGNDVKALVDAAIAVYMVTDAVVRTVASTMIIIDPDLAKNSALKNMCMYGVAAAAGNHAAAVQRTVFMLVSLYDSYTQFSSVSGLVKMGSSSAKILTAGVMAGSSLVGSVFQFMDLIKVYKGDEASSDLNMQAASMGGIEGLISIIVDKSGLRDQIIKFLSSDAIGLSKADATMVDQMAEMAFYMAMAIACNFMASEKATPPATANGLAAVGNKYTDMLPEVLKNLLKGFMEQVKKDGQEITSTMMRTLMFTMTMSQVAFSAQNLSLAVMEYKLQVASAQAKKDMEIQSLRNQIYAGMQNDIEGGEQSANNIIQSSVSVIKQIYKDIQSIAQSGANTGHSAL
ncbi:MAG: hypothetical protein KBD37_03035 [Burkholderiales bacterium]|nr:hypothetical protein [Burkholderiales bacterium]